VSLIEQADAKRQRNLPTHCKIITRTDHAV
jgi:hypothetical protein